MKTLPEAPAPNEVTVTETVFRTLVADDATNFLCDRRHH
jgi:hypothetical protein